MRDFSCECPEKKCLTRSLRQTDSASRIVGWATLVRGHHHGTPPSRKSLSAEIGFPLLTSFGTRLRDKTLTSHAVQEKSQRNRRRTGNTLATKEDANGKSAHPTEVTMEIGDVASDLVNIRQVVSPLVTTKLPWENPRYFRPHQMCRKPWFGVSICSGPNSPPPITSQIRTNRRMGPITSLP